MPPPFAVMLRLYVRAYVTFITSHYFDTFYARTLKFDMVITQT